MTHANIFHTFTPCAAHNILKSNSAAHLFRWCPIECCVHRQILLLSSVSPICCFVVNFIYGFEHKWSNWYKLLCLEPGDCYRTDYNIKLYYARTSICSTFICFICNRMYLCRFCLRVCVGPSFVRPHLHAYCKLMRWCCCWCCRLIFSLIFIQFRTEFNAI